MKIEYTDESQNHYVYIENFWTGKKELAVNGQYADKVSKKEFKLPNENAYATLKGNFITGVKLITGNGKEIILCRNKWYEWILVFLPLLNLGLGVLGGAIGGGLSGLFGFLGAFINATILRTKLNIIVKIVCCFATVALSFAAWFLIYALIVGGLNAAFPSLFS